MGSKVVGIDLGTTNSCISVIKDGFPMIIPIKNKRVIPSIVHYGKDIKVGSSAKKMLLTEPSNTIYGVKRLIGRKYDDESVKRYSKNLPYSLARHHNGDVWIKMNNLVSPVQVSSEILKYLKRKAEKFIGKEIRSSVITVPAYFNEIQRKATKDAGTLAGLKVERIVNEPTAAALSYGAKDDGIVAVYDFGGGTFDVSILNCKDGVFDVRSTNGNTSLGGDDVDYEIVEYLIDKLRKERRDVVIDKKFRSDLKQKAEGAKKSLSTCESVTVEVSGYKIPFTRTELERISKKVVDRTVEPCEKAMRDANVPPENIKHVVMVGGMTKMPLVRKTVEKIFGRRPILGVDPDEAVAKGAAIQAGVLSGDVKDALLLDVVALTLGIETVGGHFSPIVERNSKLPLKTKKMFTTSEDNQTDVEINIYQGESAFVKHNKLLGNLRLKDIPPSKKGVPRIEVEFNADCNGIYKVTAKDIINNKEQLLEIAPSSGLTKDEIDRIIKESHINEKKDNKSK